MHEHRRYEEEFCIQKITARRSGLNTNTYGRGRKGGKGGKPGGKGVGCNKGIL